MGELRNGIGLTLHRVSNIFTGYHTARFKGAVVAFDPGAAQHAARAGALRSVGAVVMAFAARRTFSVRKVVIA